MGDISARRGRVTGMDAHAGMHSIDGIVPLSEMFGYATDLRSKTQGRGNYTMQFAHYEEVPHSIAEKILGHRA
jgi:elongation factor G